MKKSLYAFMVLIIGLSMTMCDNPKENEKQSSQNQLTKQEKAEGWELLFDGTNMNQWRAYLEDSVIGWDLREECMVAESKGKDIITKEVFENFELSIEWKIAENSNSGIFFNVVEDTAYHAVYATGPEYQLLDDKGFEGKVSDSQYSGANYAMHAPLNAQVKALDQFNHTLIRVKDGHVEHFLNGDKVVEYDLWTDDWKERVSNCKWKDHPGYGQAKSGHIALQDHGGTTMFRNIKIRKL